MTTRKTAAHPFASFTGWEKAQALWRRLFPPCPAHEQAVTLLFPHPVLWLLLPVLTAGAAAWIHFSGLTIAGGRQILDMLPLLALFMLVAHLLSRLGMARGAVFLYTLVFFILFKVIGKLLSYLFMSLQPPLIDAQLAAIDAWLGFNWLGYFAFVNAHPLLARVLDVAYASYMWMFPITFLWLSVTGRLRRMRAVIILFSLTGLVTVTIGGLLPALTGFGHYQPEPALYANMPHAGPPPYLDHIRRLVSGEMRIIDLDRMFGIISVPSFHTIMALLFPWALRGTLLHWPAWIVAVLTIAATPVFGHHYIADIIAGVIVFYAVVWAMRAAGLTDDAPAPARATRAMPQAAE